MQQAIVQTTISVQRGNPISHIISHIISNIIMWQFSVTCFSSAIVKLTFVTKCYTVCDHLYFNNIMEHVVL